MSASQPLKVITVDAFASTREGLWARAKASVFLSRRAVAGAFYVYLRARDVIASLNRADSSASIFELAMGRTK
jgi:hypothetical protein